MEQILATYGPWGLCAVATIALWRERLRQDERYVELVERMATALKEVADELPEIRRALKRGDE